MTWFLLARELGMSVARAKSEISSSEFTGWLALMQIDALPDVKRQNEAAAIQRTFASSISGKQFKLQDFMLKYSPTVKKTGGQIRTALRHWLSMAGIRNKE